MKSIVFPAYDPAERDELFGRPPVVDRAWQIAFTAITNGPVGGSIERTQQTLNLMNALAGLSYKDGDQRHLKVEGGAVTVDDAEVKLLIELVGKFRENLTGALSDAVAYLDGVLAGAKSPIALVLDSATT